MNELIRPELYGAIASIIERSRAGVRYAVNVAMVDAYWEIGRLIFEEEQQGKDRADYGARLVDELSSRLTRDFGSGFDPSNVRRMRLFYRTFSNRAAMRREFAEDASGIFSAVRRELPNQTQRVDNKDDTISAAVRHESDPDRPAYRPELSWTHYKALIRIEKPQAREWYMNEAIAENWSTRALERQINSLYYERQLSSADRTPVRAEAEAKTRALTAQPEEFLKDPYVLEFLDLADRPHFRESELEQAIIDRLQHFLLELGRGFAFVARQKRITTETKEFYIDLVFYNYHLKCFVLIDLKVGELTHQDVSQMDMYVRMFDDLQRGDDDNPTVGLILCTEKDETIVKYSVLEESRQLFASKYLLYLPNEEELRIELEREKRLAERELAEREEEKSRSNTT